MNPAISNFAARTVADGLKIFSFSPQLTAAEWAEQRRRMPSGRYSFDTAPYQREMTTAPFEPDTQLTAYMMFSRGGKTEVFMNILGHAIAEEPRHCIVMYPTTGQAERWSKLGLEKELIEPTPSLQHMVRGGRRTASNTITFKLWPGGSLSAYGANAGDLRRSKGSLMIADEVDAIENTISDEGDILDVLWVRGSEYSNSVRIAASYPSVKNDSRIEGIMNSSDYRKWHTACHSCGELIVMHRDHLTYPADKPELAELLCPKCSASISCKQRRQMVMEAGQWIATQPFNGIVGFHGNAMMSPWPNQKGYKSHLHWIADQEIKAEKSDDRARAIRVIVNTIDAETYEPETVAGPDPSELFKRREHYNARRMLPPGVLLIQAGFDVQKRWIEVSIVGFGENKESWMLEHTKIQGRVDEESTWQNLTNYLQDAKFPHPIYGEVALFTDGKPVSVFGDAGHWTDTVLGWTRKFGSLGVFGIFGSPTITGPIVGRKRKNPKPPCEVYPLCVNAGKGIIYARLSLEKTKADGDHFPEGYIHFPQSVDEEYFSGLTAEYGKEEKYRGAMHVRYVCPAGVRNEPLDTMNYARAAMLALDVDFDALKQTLDAEAKAAGKNREAEANQPARRQPRPARKGWATDF